MKVTYMLSPTTPYIMHTQASNILSSNLKRDDRIEAFFNLSILSLNMGILKDRNHLIEKMGDHPLEIFLKKSSPNFLRILGAIHSNKNGFFDRVLSTIKTDIVMVTCWNIYSIPFIKFLLENGKRVVMGGSFCNSYSIEFIRSIIDHKNLVIVKGYVGMDTDLYKIVNDWRDIEILSNDYTDMWCARNDHIKDYLNLLSKCRGLDNTYYSITFNNNCWYNKCKFCKLREGKEPNFIEHMEVEQLYDNIVKNLKSYKSKNVLVNDNYFVFNDQNKQVLKKLRRDGYKIYVLSGIISFNNKKYLEDINEYVDEIGIGLESANDFSLNYITKGYNWNDIKRSIGEMSVYLNRDKNIRYLVIADLVCEDQRGIIQNYKNMAIMKDMLHNNGFERVVFSFTPLQLFPSVGMVKETEYLKIRNKDVSGMWYVYNYLEKIGVEINVPENIMMPFERYDINGNLLLSDFEYISEDLMNKIV